MDNANIDDEWQRQVIESLYRTHSKPIQGTLESLDFEIPFPREVTSKPVSKYFGNTLWDAVTFWRGRTHDPFFPFESLHHPRYHEYKLQHGRSNISKDMKTLEKTETAPTLQVRNTKTLRQKYQPFTYKQLPMSRLRRTKPKQKIDPEQDKNQRRILPTLSNTFTPIDFYASYPNLTQQLKRYMMEGEHLAADMSPSNRSSRIHDAFILDRELKMQLRIDPQYTKRLAHKLRSVDDVDDFLEKEMQQLLDRGKQRETDIQRSVRFLSQYMLHHDQKDLQYAITGGKKKIKRDSIDDTSLGYRVQREIELNKRIMSVLDRAELFEDPFGLGLEPSICPTHPLSYDVSSIFDARPDKEEKSVTEFEARKKRRMELRHEPSTRNMNDTLPLIPKRRTRMTSSLPFFGSRFGNNWY